MVSEFVRTRRNELRLTQQQLADKAGVSLSVVKRFEDNKPYSPIRFSLSKVCKALNADTTFVLLDLKWPERKKVR